MKTTRVAGLTAPAWTCSPEHTGFAARFDSVELIGRPE
jgi:hypothetical protein